MDDFTKRPETYAILNQKDSTVAEALITNLFCRLEVPRELHSGQGRNFKCRLMQDVLQRVGMNKTSNTHLHPQSNGMVERDTKGSMSNC
jgi:hypothetical protein